MFNRLFLVLAVTLSISLCAAAESDQEKQSKTNDEVYSIATKLQKFEKDIERVNTNTNTILTVCGIVLTVAVLFGIGGPVTVFVEARNSHRKYKAQISEFNAAREDAIKSLQKDLHNIRVELDQHNRIVRLSRMLIEKNYDEEIFYADLRQLETRPNYLMIDLVNQIFDLKPNPFSGDIIEIAESIRTKLTGH